MRKVAGAREMASPQHPEAPPMKTALRTVRTGLLIGLPALVAPAFAEDAPAAAPELTANIGLVSEYVFRGIRQTWGNPAIQGGVDYAHASGFYAGAWMSNTSANLYANANVEIDLYGGYRGAVGDFSYDVGLLQFIFPKANYDKITPAGSYASKTYDTTELYLSGTWQWLNVKYSRALTDVGYFGFTSNNAGFGAFPNKPNAGVTGKDTTGSWYIEANIAYEFIPKIYESHSIVFTHGGAGTLLHLLTQPHPPTIIAIANNTLADNHQTELITQLNKDNYLLGFCSIQ